MIFNGSAVRFTSPSLHLETSNRLSPRFPSVVVLLLAMFWGIAPESLQVAHAQEDVNPFQQKVYEDDDGMHRYAVFVPEGYTPEKKWPVILFLHGAGECGKDGMVQTTVGLGPYVKERRATFPFITVFPQCEDMEGRILGRWQAGSPDAARALKILETVEKDYSVDGSHRILTGWSMGGYGTWSLGASDPDRWSAIVPLAGGGDTSLASKLVKTPIWAFHGVRDQAVRVEESRKMIAAIKAAGGAPIYTEAPDQDHDIWKLAYASDALYAWMLNPKMQDPSAKLLAKPRSRTKKTEVDAEAPFRPALYIPQAMYVRLGNDMLKSLADSVPFVVPANIMSGRIGDMFDSTSTQGLTFSVRFSNISYSGQLARASLQAYYKDRLNVQLALSNVQLYIGSTYVSGSGRSASAGPISIVLGHRRPIWLSFDVTPYVDRGKIRLRLLETRFSIPPDNFYVSGPAGVSTRGLGMTQERVASGLVSGLYGARYRIESEVRNVVPTLLGQLEKQLDVSAADQLAGSIWPLPVYQPRIKTWPQEVVTDENGVSLVMGFTVGALTPQSKAEPRWADAAGLSAAEVPKVRKLQVGIAPEILEPLSELLIDDDLARIHVLDTPVKNFAPLADPKALAEAFPDLKRYGDNLEVWSELILTKPLKVNDGGTASDGSPQMNFDLQSLAISLAIRPEKGKGDWIPFAEIRYSIDQRAHPKLVKPTDLKRALELEWDGIGGFEATPRFAPGYIAEDPTMKVAWLKEVFEAGWKEWTQAGPAARVAVPDIDFGYAKQRLEGVSWNQPNLQVMFDNPKVKLTNLTEVDFVYETKGPYSDWGAPITLKPGESQTFDIAYPLLYRRQTARGYELYTLPVGSHSEYRVPKKGGPPALFEARSSVASTNP